MQLEKKGGIELGRTKVDKEIILQKAAQIVNASKESNLSLKVLAEDLGIQSPSLYYYFKNLEDLKRELMFYGWQQMENYMLLSMVGVSGYEALKAMGHAFFDYATKNPGVFDIMLWYNQYENEKTLDTISKTYVALMKIMGTLNISEVNANHLIRTFRGFLQGFAQLVNHGAFGNPVSIADSFDLSLDIIFEGMKTIEGK